MNSGGSEVIGIILQVLILFSLVIITDRLLKIQRLAEGNQDKREEKDNAFQLLAEAVKRLTGRLEGLEETLKNDSRKASAPKPRLNPEIRKTRKICPECEAFIPVDDPRCSNCGFFFNEPG